MRSILLSICPAALWCISALELFILILALRGWKKSGKALNLCTALICVGLFLDAFLIAMGSLASGAFLAGVSRIRFISHGVLIPLLFPICGYALGWKKKGMTVLWVLTGILMAAGLAESLAQVLEMKEIAGVTRYVSADATPAWASGLSSLLSYGTVVPLILAGVAVWIRQKTPYIFLAGFLMFAFSALGPATGNFDLIFFISMFGEICMVWFLYLYSRREK